MFIKYVDEWENEQKGVNGISVSIIYTSVKRSRIEKIKMYMMKDNKIKCDVHYYHTITLNEEEYKDYMKERKVFMEERKEADLLFFTQQECKQI